MAKKIINEVKQEPARATSSMLDGENKPKFLTRKNDEEAREGRREIDDYLKGKRSRKMTKPIIWIVGLIILAVLFFVVSSMFTSAKVSVTPRGESVTLDEKVTAAKNPSEGQLGFSVATIEDQAQTLVAQTGTKRVERKATGRIAVFNSFSEKPYKLIAKTRFQRPDGKIYRISNSITIPGYKVVGGKTVPGSIEVTITADAAGADYNGDASDFTIPGLKGDPAFDKIFGRSVTPISGGYAGDVYVISESEKSTARTTLAASLDKSLREKLASQVTQEMVILENTIAISTGELEEPPVTGTATTDKVPVSARGILRAIVIPQTDLATYIAHNHLSDYGGEPVHIKDISSISIASSSALPKDLDSIDKIDLTLKGSAAIEWIFNKDDLTQKLIGVGKSAATGIFAQFPQIEGAKVYMRPPWARTFPKDAGKITIEVEVPKEAAE